MRCEIRDTGCGMRDASFGMRVTGYGIRDMGDETIDHLEILYETKSHLSANEHNGDYSFE